MSPFKSAELSEGELQQLYEFRCQDARCFKPADRAYVMAAIVEEFGSEAAFDLYVRKELPGILAECKKRYSRLLQTIGAQNLEHIAGE